MKPKEITIKITSQGETAYDIVVAEGTEQEKSFHTNDGSIGLRGRFIAIVDQLGTFFPPEETEPDATPSPTS